MSLGKWDYFPVIVFLFAGMIWGCSRKETSLIDEKKPAPRMKEEAMPVRYSPAEKPRNLVFISLDTLRGDHLGAYGNDLPISPFLDRFSQHSVIFPNHFSQCPSTSPSHRAVFTSRYLSSQEKVFEAPENTLAGTLANHGFRTAGIVDGGHMDKKFGVGVGFQHYDSEYCGTVRVLKKARKWLMKNMDTPFFLFIHTYQIHAPYNPEGKYSDIFTQGFEPDPSLRELNTPKIDARLSEFSEDEKRFLSLLYKAGVRSCDAKLNRFFEFLKDNHLWENTIVAIMSDHGENLGERRYWGHNTPYYHQLYVPFLVYVPGMQPRVVSLPTENIDIAPTLLHYLNVEIPKHFQGRNLAPYIENTIKNTSGCCFQVAEGVSKTGRTIMSPNMWKLIVKETASDDELYRIDEDPDETRNLIATHAREANILRMAMKRRLNIDDNSLRSLRYTGAVNFVIHAPGMKVDNHLDAKLKGELEALGYMDN